MMNVSNDDKMALINGLPPQSEELIDYLTVPHDWLELMKTYCLSSMINQGGSKVKVLYGSMATGKSHYMKSLKNYAQRDGFFVIDIDLTQAGFHLTNTVAFYKAIVARIDLDRLNKVLCGEICRSLGYEKLDLSAYPGKLSEYLSQQEGIIQGVAKREIRKVIHAIVNSLELEFSFHRFLCIYMEALVDKDIVFKKLAKDWFLGKKLISAEKSLIQLYETLAKHNARIWIYSLFEIIKYMGYKGIVIIFDQFEAVLPKAEAQVQYTSSKRNDVYQLIRQLIDDLDFFKNTLILVSGNSEIINNEKYGMQSYHALWMRIQPGFQQLEKLNVYADLIDMDMLFHDLREKGLLAELQKRLETLGFQESGDNAVEKIPKEMQYRNFRDVIGNQVQQI